MRNLHLLKQTFSQARRASGTHQSNGAWTPLTIFETIEEVQQIATEWLWTYNNERPNMGIGGVTPAQKLKMAA